MESVDELFCTKKLDLLFSKNWRDLISHTQKQFNASSWEFNWKSAKASHFMKASKRWSRQGRPFFFPIHLCSSLLGSEADVPDRDQGLTRVFNPVLPEGLENSHLVWVPFPASVSGNLGMPEARHPWPWPPSAFAGGTVRFPPEMPIWPALAPAPLPFRLCTPRWPASQHRD